MRIETPVLSNANNLTPSTCLNASLYRFPRYRIPSLSFKHGLLKKWIGNLLYITWRNLPSFVYLIKLLNWASFSPGLSLLLFLSGLDETRWTIVTNTLTNKNVSFNFCWTREDISFTGESTQQCRLRLIVHHLEQRPMQTVHARVNSEKWLMSAQREDSF